MTLLSVVNDVCAVTGVHQLQSVFNEPVNKRTALEMLALANEMAQRIAYNEREWQALIETVTFTGDGVTEKFPLPANYRRMLLNSNVWRFPAIQPMRFIPSAEQWLQRRLRNYSDAWGEWIIFVDMHIQPIMGAGITAQFNYLSKNCINLYSGGRGDTFMNESDTFVLDERLLKLGMIWQWKANKGSPYAEDMATYADAISSAMGADKPSPTLIDRAPISAAARMAYPFSTPTSADWSWPLG